MRLEMEISHIIGLRLGAMTCLVEGTLEVNPADLQQHLAEDRRLGRVEIEIAHPGESARICRVFDAFEPRAKVGEGENFPGVLGRLALAGAGRTRALRGAAVLMADQLAPGFDPVIDMVGPGAAYTPFARTQNIVVATQPAPGTAPQAYQSAVRLAGLKPGVFLAQACIPHAPDRVAVYELPPLSHIPPESRHLPRVAYVFQIHSHQRPTGIEEGIFYGDNVRRLIPTLVHPNEILDGAVLRRFMGRNATTYAVQNHPVIEALYRQHGKDLCLPGSS
jgi:glycine reductase